VKKVPVGVLGLGWFGEKHVSILSNLPNVELTAVCSRTEARAREVASKYGVKKVYTDWQKLVKDQEIDALTVTNNVQDHAAPVVGAAEAGKNVFVEKPISNSLEEADRMIAATERAGALFMVGHVLRFENRYAQAKRMIDEGRIGRVVSIYTRRNLPAGFVRSQLKNASSLMLDGIHDTDLILWYYNRRAESVYATQLRVGEVEHPNVGWTVYKFGGAVGVSETAWILRANTLFTGPPSDARMEVLGTEGAIYVDCTENGLLVNDKDGSSKPDTIHWPLMHNHITGALKDEVEYWINCVANGRKPEVAVPHDARMALEMVLAAEQSAKINREVRL
jgi:UDP-N-acetylglucosamine 3-dehydrogenase